MVFSRVLQTLVCIVLAAGAVAGVYSFDRSRNVAVQKEYGLQIARQIASQAEGFVFAAKMKEADDPVGEAIRTLSQGVDPRVILVGRVQGEAGSAVTSEERFDALSGTTEYLKVLTPESGAGIKVTVQQVPRGLFGARGQLESDLTAAAVFLASLFSFLFMTNVFFRKREGTVDASPFKDEVASWSGEAKSTLITLTAGLRDALKQTQTMSKATSKSLEAVALLHSRIHGGLEELHQSKKTILESEKAISELEVSSLSVVMAAHRLGAGGRNLTRASSDLHRRIQRLRKVLNTSKEAVEKLEVSLEPCVTDADLAFHSFDGFKDQATILNEHVRKTTEAISAENRLIQDLSERARA
jgi:hypothetical protein